MRRGLLSSFSRRCAVALGWLAAPLLVALTLPAPAAAARPDHIETPEEAIAQDAQVYASQYGVSQDEAIRRLRAQDDSVATVERLAAIYADRLAGISIDHRPDYRVTILLTGSEPVPDVVIYAGGMNLPIHFATGAPATRRAIVAAIMQHQGELRAMLPFAIGMGADARSGRLAVTVTREKAESFGPAMMRGIVEAIAGVPARIVEIDQAESNAALYGGTRVTGLLAATGRRGVCTAGFAVTDGTRTGLATAAHCPDNLSYRDADGSDIALSLVGKWASAYQDVEISTASQPLLPLFRPDPRGPDVRPVTAARSREETWTGDFVCHAGMRSGYSCAEVQFVDYAPHPVVCGMLCDPRWVTVAGPACGKGDSGGPVFSGTIAFGIAKGVSRVGDACGFYFYMSTDYLPPGWSPLRETLPAAENTAAPAEGAATP